MSKFDFIRPISVADARPLRAAILRPGLPLSESIYPLDDHPDSHHFGAFIDERLVGTATVLHQSALEESASTQHNPESPWLTADAWRLRGMTVVDECRGRGYGAQLFNSCLDHARSRRGTCLWFNARDTAVGFYRHLGCRAVGQPQELPGHGFYVVMWRPLDEG